MRSKILKEKARSRPATGHSYNVSISSEDGNQDYTKLGTMLPQKLAPLQDEVRNALLFSEKKHQTSFFKSELPSAPHLSESEDDVDKDSTVSEEAEHLMYKPWKEEVFDANEDNILDDSLYVYDYVN